MSKYTKLASATAALLAVGALAACSSGASPAAEEPAATEEAVSWDVSSVETPRPAEDLIALPGSDAVVASLPGGEGAASGTEGASGEAEAVSGRVSLLSAESGEELAAYPDADAPEATPAAPFAECPSEPDRARFSPHGIDAIETAEGQRIFAVNHGGRESVEVFDVAGDELTWVGCVILPEGTSGNGVAAVGEEGDFVVTNFYDPALGAKAFEDMFIGVDTGDVRAWHAGEGWETIPGSEAPGPNGVLVSPDGEDVYAAIWTEKTVVRLPIGGGEPETVAEFDFLPDNLRWSEDGRILVTGQDIDADDIITCNAGKGTDCPEGFVVDSLDPETGDTETVYETEEESDILLATVAAAVNDEIWVGNLGRPAIARLTPES